MMESSLFCQACNKHCNSSQQFLDHIKSPAHLAQEKKIPDFTVSNKGVLPVPTNTGIEHVLGSSFTGNLVSSGQERGSNALTPPSAGMEFRHEAKVDTKDKSYTMNGSKGRCFVCQIDLTSYDHCSQHVNGKNHAKKVQQLERERASGNSFMPLQPQVFTPNYSPQMPDNQGTRQGFEASPAVSGLVLQCKLCKVPFSCEQNAKEHFVGKKHRKQLEWLKFEKGESFLDDFSSDPDQTPVLRVAYSSCNNPTPDVATSTASFEQHRMGPRSLLTNEEPADTGLISDNSDNDTPSVTNFAIPPSSVKRSQELRRTCSENLCENNDKMSLPGKKLDALSLHSGYSHVSSISDNNMQPSNIPNIGPVNLEAREAKEHLTSWVSPAQRSLSCPSVSPNAISASVPSESVSDEDCYRFDGKRGRCYACRVELTSRDHALQHLNGEKHKKKSRLFKIHPNNMRHSEKDKEVLDTNDSESPLVVTKGSNLVKKLPEMNEKYFYFSGTTGYCYACKCPLSSRLQAEEHIKGRPHERNIEILHVNQQGKILSQRCEACDVSFTGEVPAIQHFSSEKHKRVAELLSCPAFPIVGIEDARMITDKNGVNWFFCDICRKPLNTKDMLLIHQKSQGHLLEKNNKNENRLHNQENAAHDTLGSFLSQTSNAAAQIPLHSVSAAESPVEKGTISESQRKMLTVAKCPVINAEPTSSLRPHYQDNIGFNQSSSVTYSHGSVAELQGGVGQERHGHQQTTDADENRTSQSISDRYPSSHVSDKKNESASQEASISSPSSSSLQSMHQNSGAGTKSHHTYAGNPTGLGDMQGSIDTIRKPSNSQTTRRGDCIRNISMNKEYDPNMVLDNDSKEKPTTVPNIVDAENFQQSRTSPPPAETTRKSAETRNRSGFPYFCELCQKPMNTSDSYDAHLKGNTHRWNKTYMKATDINLGDINKNVNSGDQEMFERGYKVTKTYPRTYQIELMQKSMYQDSVIYLPTGTGKTLVSVMTMGLMLEDNFQRPVIFLVDKILLVIQQGRYIEEELQVKSKKYMRYSLNDRGKREERSLNLAFVCGGMTHSQGIPLWQHDIIVTTAAYCFNMLEKGIIRWEHFSLAVFDEVHHCHKDHPYKKLISCYHTKISNPAKRPKILGLSASPAGKDTVENTLEMLKRLLDTLGGSRIAIPEGRAHDELKKYQSDPRLRIFCVPLTSKEQEFQLECYKYFLRCYRKLAPMSALCKSQEIPLCNFNAVLYDSSEEALNFLANNLLIDPEPLSEITPHVLNANCTLPPLSEECQGGVFDSLRLHMVKFLLNVSAIPTGVDFKEMEKIFEPSGDNHELENARNLGLPCDSMKQHILHFKHNEQGILSPMLDRLLMILQDSQYIDWNTTDSMALVLVRERKQARNVSKKLQQADWLRGRGLRITHLVGHGKGANDEGMHVKQQKRVLDNHKDFHILVATSIAEEGIDIRKLGLVISMNPPSTVRALVQMRGRARLKDSHFVILCATAEEEEKLNKLIKQEENMLKAAQICLDSQR